MAIKFAWIYIRGARAHYVLMAVTTARSRVQAKLLFDETSFEVQFTARSMVSRRVEAGDVTSIVRFVKDN